MFSETALSLNGVSATANWDSGTELSSELLQPITIIQTIPTKTFPSGEFSMCFSPD
jgi:hypothetical protein